MIDPDFLRLVKLGAIEMELRTLEAGGIPSRTSSRDQGASEIARRAYFLADLGRRVLSTSVRN